MSERCVPLWLGCHLFCAGGAGREIKVKEDYKTYLPTFTCGTQRSLVHGTYTTQVLGSKKQQGGMCERYLSALIKSLFVYLCAYMNICKSALGKFDRLSVRISVLVNIYFWQCTLDVHAGGDL